ncbi:aminotransferase DegT [Candidatus Pacearchaeota archaeon]|nr:aminotransferase DegT [Candidatus Pacearchaeota archaeon]|tara:strand:+ start:2569 stop:3702 length:1134 start_codon:yes stop_codon:yes gene_type:complete
MINIFQPSVGVEELELIKDIFKSNWIGLGSKTNELEEQLSSKLDVSSENVTLTNSCSEAIFQVFEYIDFIIGEEVILPSMSFLGAGNAILEVGATPVFCEVDERTLNPSVEDIESKISPKTKAVFITHYGGLPCDIDGIVKLCDKYNLILIEDSAGSPFSKYKGKNVGIFGDFGVWSFDPLKVMTMGDGGLIYSKSRYDMIKLREQRYLGLKSSTGFSNKIDKKWWEFEISTHGRRSIVNDLSSSLGLEQLKKVDKFIERRKEISCFYDENISKLSWLKIPPKFPDYVESSYYFYWIQVEKNRDELANYLKENEIYTTFRYYPLHLLDYYKEFKTDLPITKKVMMNTLLLPIHQSLTDDDIAKVVKTIKKFGKENEL